jgi:hypothetical protein
MIYILAIALPILVYFGQEARIAWVKWDVEKTVSERERSVCTGKVAQIQNAINQSVLDNIDAAVAAGNEVSSSPSDPAGLKDLCDSDPDCRERGRP